MGIKTRLSLFYYKINYNLHHDGTFSRIYINDNKNPSYMYDRLTLNHVEGMSKVVMRYKL